MEPAFGSLCSLPLRTHQLPIVYKGQTLCGEFQVGRNFCPLCCVQRQYQSKIMTDNTVETINSEVLAALINDTNATAPKDALGELVDDLDINGDGTDAGPVIDVVPVELQCGIPVIPDDQVSLID